MITVIVTFKISEEINANILKDKFVETSTLYQDVKGLLRKNYITDIENCIAGGVYTFASRQDANNWFDEDRINWIAERYSKPEIKFYENPRFLCSEVKPILCASQNSNEMDFDSIITSWKFTSSDPGKTLIKDIFRLKPGTNLQFINSQIQINQFNKLHPEKWFDFFSSSPSINLVNIISN